MLRMRQATWELSNLVHLGQSQAISGMPKLQGKQWNQLIIPGIPGGICRSSICPTSTLSQKSGPLRMDINSKKTPATYWNCVYFDFSWWYLILLPLTSKIPFFSGWLSILTLLHPPRSQQDGRGVFLWYSETLVLGCPKNDKLLSASKNLPKINDGSMFDPSRLCPGCLVFICCSGIICALCMRVIHICPAMKTSLFLVEIISVRTESKEVAEQMGSDKKFSWTPKNWAPEAPPSCSYWCKLRFSGTPHVLSALPLFRAWFYRGMWLHVDLNLVKEAAWLV